MSPNRPRGRRPGNDDTRGTIRTAAAKLFSGSSYDKVSLRAIAREADVDPALVHHYFASKGDLYVQACLGIEWDLAGHVHQILAGDGAGVGLRATKSFLEHWDDHERWRVFLATLSADAPDGTHQVSAMVAREVFAPVASHFGHANAVLRAQLAVSALLGVIVARHQLDFPALATTSLRSLVAPLANTLQHYLVDAW